MQEVPVVLFHRSEQPYVVHALRAAAIHNRDVTIITDTASAKYGAEARVELISEYPEDLADRFKQAYRHLSSNSYTFEYTAIEKYFYLLAFMKRHGSNRIVYIDSDVMLFENMSELIRNYFEKYDLGFAMPDQVHEEFYWTASGHIAIWTAQALEAFCNFIVDTYENHLEIFDPKWEWHQANQIPGGINDMTLIYLFQRSTTLNCISLLKVFDNQFTFDNAIRWGMNEFADEYKLRYNFYSGFPVKDIRFRDHKPYGYNLLLGREIRFCLLHFQGSAKNLMPFYFTGKKSLYERLELLIWRLRLLRYQQKSLLEMFREYRLFSRKLLTNPANIFRRPVPGKQP